MTARTLDTISNEMNMLSKEINTLQNKYSKLRKEKELVYKNTIVPTIKHEPLLFIFNSKAQDQANMDYKEINQMKNDYISKYFVADKKHFGMLMAECCYEESGLNQFKISIYSDSSNSELKNMVKFFNHMINIGYDPLPKEDYIPIMCMSNDLSANGQLELRINKETSQCSFGIVRFGRFTENKNDSLFNILKYIRQEYWYGTPYKDEDKDY
jgi:hypothetical protein